MNIDANLSNILKMAEKTGTVYDSINLFRIPAEKSIEENFFEKIKNILKSSHSMS